MKCRLAQLDRCLDTQRVRFGHRQNARPLAIATRGDSDLELGGSAVCCSPESVRHQWRDASAASTAPAALTRTSSTEDTRSSHRTYCAVSRRAEQPAPSARIRGTDASAANRIGAKNPSGADRKSTRLN